MSINSICKHEKLSNIKSRINSLRIATFGVSCVLIFTLVWFSFVFKVDLCSSAERISSRLGKNTDSIYEKGNIDHQYAIGVKKVLSLFSEVTAYAMCAIQVLLISLLCVFSISAYLLHRFYLKIHDHDLCDITLTENNISNTKDLEHKTEQE
jgi:hypothetical protein